MRDRAWRRHKFITHRRRAIRRILWRAGFREVEGPYFVSRFRAMRRAFYFPVHRAVAWPRSGEIEPEWRLRPYKRHGRRHEDHQS